MDSYSILTGVGRFYLAPANTAAPTAAAAITPAGPWRDLGDTQDGVEVDLSQKVELTRTDQRTGAVKAVRSEEALKLKTKLAENTLENLGDALGNSVTDTPAGAGTVGTRALNFHRGATVNEYAFLFIGYSPYLNGPAMYWIPRGYFDLDSIKFDKAKNAPIPFTFEALEDLNAATEDERFGRLIAMDAAAL